VREFDKYPLRPAGFGDEARGVLARLVTEGCATRPARLALGPAPGAPASEVDARAGVDRGDLPKGWR
jgi:hypothetical protein